MMDNTNNVTMRIEFDIAAQKCLSQVILNNQHIEQLLQSGIQKAFDSFDFEAIVIEATKQAIRNELKDSSSYGKLRDMVRKKADEIAENYLDKKFEILTNGIKNL